MPSLGEVALTIVCERASYLRAMKSLEKPMWEATVQVKYRSLTPNSTWVPFGALLDGHESYRLDVVVQVEERLKWKYRQVQGTPSRYMRLEATRLELRFRSYCEVHLPSSDYGSCLLQRLGDQADGCCDCLPQSRGRI